LRDWLVAAADLSDKRWSIIVAHRRAGKTVAEINKLVRRAVGMPARRAALSLCGNQLDGGVVASAFIRAISACTARSITSGNFALSHPPSIGRTN
jgi:hypothetical protein